MKLRRHTAFLLVIMCLMPFFAYAKNISPRLLQGHKNTMNFSVWAPTQKDAEIIAEGLEDYYSRFLKDLECGAMMKKKPLVYIFLNYHEYLDNLKLLGYNAEHTGGLAIPRSARRPAEIYSFLSNNLMDSVLPHEITHLLFKEVLAGLKVDARIPLWLNEGMAVYEERSHKYRQEVNRALAKNALIPVSDIVNFEKYPENLSKRSLFYAESASLVEFLITEYGGRKFTSFAKKTATGGKSVDEALHSTYYPQLKNVSQLSDAWLEFLKR